MPCETISPSESAQLSLLTSLLSVAIGERQALTISSLQSSLCHTSRRQTELFLQLFLGHLPFAVVASSSGYFRPTSASEINHYRQSNLSRIKCLAVRNRTVRLAARREGWPFDGHSFSDAPRQLEFSHLQ